MYGLLIVPRATRTVAGIFSAIAISDFLHQAYELVNARAAVVAKQAEAEDKTEEGGNGDGAT